ncbi:MAG: helix-turn-helix transcriptional regulator [Clostridia bacterium]|nr:helix-turn-helix transcriptional regulator [Clostridia bacterium]
MHYTRLKDLREDHDMTQQELVNLLGMHKTTYTNYEQGKRELPLSLAVRLAKLYNVSLDYIAGLSGEPKPIDGENLYTRMNREKK